MLTFPDYTLAYWYCKRSNQTISEKRNNFKDTQLGGDGDKSNFYLD